MKNDKAETNEIRLSFPDNPSRVAGKDYGKDIYQGRIHPNIDRSRINDVIFPDNIKGVSILFVAGLMGDEVKRYGTAAALSDHFRFLSPYPDVERSIAESIRILGR